MEAPNLTTFSIILSFNSVSGPTQLTVAWEWGLGCKICSTQIIKLLTGVRGGMLEDGLFLCVHMSGDTQTHTQNSEPWCPSIFGLSSSFTASNLPPSAGHSELPTMATYVPTGRARDMPLGACTPHKHTQQPGWHDNVSVESCVCIGLKTCHVPSFQPL